MHMTKSSIVRVCGAAAALFLFGCGSSSIAGDPAANFVGSWTFATGSIQPMCNLAGIPAVDLTGDTMTVTRVDPTHVATMLTGTGVMCDVNFTVSGMTATAEANQTCAFTVSVGGTSTAVTVDITSWTLTVSGDSLTMNMSGSANIQQIITCTPMGMGVATRPPAG
jgi:hypothetical protein